MPTGYLGNAIIHTVMIVGMTTAWLIGRKQDRRGR